MLAPSAWRLANASISSEVAPSGRLPSVRWYEVALRLFSSCDEPTACRRPLCRMATRSPKASASSRKWVVRMIARPNLESEMICHTVRRDTGSIPAVGSSRRTNLGLPMSAHARESLRFCPPDNVSVRALNLDSSRPTSASSFSTAPLVSCFSLIPLTAPISWRFSRH
eukprot:scaffold327856_cov54-Tisochrysis_lutea.AAC.1